MDRGCGTYIQWNITQPQNNAICSYMDEPRGYHTKRSEKDRQTPYYITYVWSVKHDTDEHQ